MRIKKVQQFSVNTRSNDWSIKQVQIDDNDGDNDLDRVEYEITDSGGTTRGTRTDSISGGKQKQKKITIDPDNAAYVIQPGETYTLTVTAYDADDNYDVETYVFSPV